MNFENIALGAVLLFIGIITLLRIPVFRFLIAGICLYIGYHCIINQTGWKLPAVTTANVKNVALKTIAHRLFYENKLVDLSTLSDTTQADIHAAFSNVTVKLNPAIPTVVTITNAFSTVALPHEFSNACGTHVYKTHDAQEAELNIHVVIGFGKLEIINS